VYTAINHFDTRTTITLADCMCTELTKEAQAGQLACGMAELLPCMAAKATQTGRGGALLPHIVR
jgi:hypothetical protein